MKLLLYLLCFIPAALFGQRLPASVSADSISLYFDRQRQVFPQEKLHLHTDRDFYVPGEKIWFKAYVVDAATHRHSTRSRYVYVELISPADTLVHRVMVRPEDGMFHGYMPITEILPEGNYTLRAYTRYMENLGDDYFFKKNIRITPLPSGQSKDVTTQTRRKRQDFEVSFFPEGGNLLEGTLCKVAFKALNSDGTPAAITGEITDENGLVVASIESFHAGMGAFILSPEPGVKYTLKCRNGNGLEKRFTLPQPHPNAYALAADQLNHESKIAVEVRKSVNTPGISLYLLAHCRGTALHFEALNAGELTVFSKEDLPAGVIHLVLFDGQMNPLSERLVFNRNKEAAAEVDFNTDKASYGRREKVVASLSLTDGAGNLPAGHFSVAVTDNGDMAADSSTTILSTLLLSSELKGYIGNPAFYLQDGIKPMIALDYLMMTHGWRRYNVPEVAKGNMEPPRIPYQASLKLAGSVKGGLLSRPVAGGEVLILTKQGIELAVTDESGRFAVGDIEYPDSTSFVIRARNSKGGDRVELAVEEESFPPPVYAPQMPAEAVPASREETESGATANAFLAKAEQRSQYDEDMRVIYLDEVEVTAPVIRQEPRLEYWANRSADRTIRREDFEEWHPLNVSNLLNMSGGVIVHYDGKITLKRGDGPPLVIIDGVYMEWPEEMLSPLDSPVEMVSVDMVESIDIIYPESTGAAVFGARGAGGAISITTRRGSDIPAERYTDNIAVLTPLGYQKPVAFYSPRYDTPEAKYLNAPDYRTTLFWKPDVVISDGHEAAGFEFYTSDFTTTYTVVIEGLTADGKIVRQEKKITVE